MDSINNSKKEEIMKFLTKKDDEWYTLNQIRKAVDIHIYKAEVLMYQLLYEKKVERDEKGKFIFWRIK